MALKAAPKRRRPARGPRLWSAKWRSRNRMDGLHEHLMYENLLPVLFRSRQACRAWINEKHGYIRDRPDLRTEPHGWKIPEAVVVEISEVLPRPGKKKGAK